MEVTEDIPMITEDIPIIMEVMEDIPIITEGLILGTHIPLCYVAPPMALVERVLWIVV
jgi:hypothetical protein